MNNERLIDELIETFKKECRNIKWEEPKPTKVGDTLYEGVAPWISDDARMKVVDAGNGVANVSIVVPSAICITIDLSDIKKGE